MFFTRGFGNAGPAQPTIKSLRIIVVTMIAGIVTFLAVALALAPLGEDPQLASVLLLVLALFAFTELPAYFIIRMVMLGKLRQTLAEKPDIDDPTPLVMPAFTTLTITGCAMAEGIALFSIVIFLLSANPLALIAPILAILIIATRFPTEDKLAGWTASLTGRRRLRP
jgi:hypothetical protein